MSSLDLSKVNKEFDEQGNLLDRPQVDTAGFKNNNTATGRKENKSSDRKQVKPSGRSQPDHVNTPIFARNPPSIFMLPKGSNSMEPETANFKIRNVKNSISIDTQQ